MYLTYRPLTPFFMGLHMSIDGWRSGRDKDGWRLREEEVNASRDSNHEINTEEPPALGNLHPPGRVKAVPILLADLEVLRKLTRAEDPPLRRVLSQIKVKIMYCYADASGSGLGCSFIFDNDSDMNKYNGVRPFKKQPLTTES
jgi:hypothetical protein